MKHYFVRICVQNDEGKLESLSSEAKGFIWPEEIGSVVVALDWNPGRYCGHGLHGRRP